MEKLHLFQQALSVKGLGTNDADASALAFFPHNQSRKQGCISRTGGAGEGEALSAVEGWQLHGSLGF
jgi:hypothetical protein